jgi:hypothetical protein
MLKMTKSATTPNPFAKLLSETLTTEFQPVTLQLLQQVTQTVNMHGEMIQTYGEAFQTLEFLAQARAVELVPLNGDPNQFKIRKLM